jgi:hypothetical protein
MTLMVADTQTGYWYCPNCETVNHTTAGIEAAFCEQCLAIVLLDDMDENGSTRAILTGCAMVSAAPHTILNGGNST